MSTRDQKRAAELLLEQYNARQQVIGVTPDQAAALQGTGTAPSDTNRFATEAESHAAVTVSSPIAITGQAIRLENNAGSPETVTAIDTGALANSDTVVPTSKAVTTAITGVSTHLRSHALDSTDDHTIGGMTNTYLVKSNGSTLAPATNTDAQVSAAVTASHSNASDHARSHAITGTSDHTSSATSGKMLKADASGLPIDASNTDTEVASAVSLKHAAVTVSAPISISTQALSLVNDAAATVTEIDTGALATASDLVIPTSKAVATYASDAVSKAHTQGSDTALGAVGTKNPPIDADLALYRDSTAGNVLVTSTWTQVKAFLKTYFDTLYTSITGRYRYAAALADTATVTLPTITANWPAHGFIHCAHASTGVISESAEFEYGSTGAVQIIRGTANIEANGATAGKISLGAAVSANPVVIKNNLGGGVSVNVMITLWYA